ncbi:MAG TPA: ABC transporter permease [Candidatus Acidoferrales bacterium]|nr:ABC transporter permease [Candidatus Acidoferrales bacterium]
MMHSLASDLRYAARELRRRPGFALTAVLSLALGVGATSAVFSVIYAVLINPFPYTGSERIMQIALKDKGGNFRYIGLTGPQMEQVRRLSSIESIVGEDGWNLTTTDSDLPEDVVACYLTPNAPSHWGTPAMMGRWLIPADALPGKEPERVVVLGYRFWQRYYSGAPDVVGRTIQLVRKPYRIVGVLPPRFRWREADIYIPLKFTLDPNNGYGVTLKIRPGISTAQANAELQPIIEQFAKENPTRFPDAFRVNLRSIIELYARPLGPTLYLLFGAVASLLLIGCGNVSILLLARGAQRQHELAVRAALGAGRGRIVRQLLTESLAIGLSGTALGILIAWKSLAFIIAWLPESTFPAESVIEMNLPVLLFSAGLAFTTAIVFGIAPAIQLSRPDVARVVQSSTRRVMGSVHGKRTHSAMVAAQVALTLLMLTAAAAAGKGFLRLVNADLGYDPRRTMSVPIPIHDGTYGTWKERSEYFEQIRARIAAMPEVVSAGISTNATPPANGGDARIEIMGAGQSANPVVRVNFVGPEYFPVLRIPLSQGRVWDRAETMRGAPVAVINQTMARQFWPNGDAVGRQIRVPVIKNEPPYRLAAAGSDGWLRIVGIVADVRNDGLRNPIKPSIYVPYSLRLQMFTQILVRTRVPPLSVLRAIRAELVQIDKEQQVMRVRDLETWIADMREYAQQRLVARLFAIFSVLALLLAAAGLYSVVSYGVATRTNEFGIRMALGARAWDVVRLVLSATSLSVGAGLAAGLVLTLVFDQLSRKWLAESSRDPVILAGLGILLVAVAASACWAPARRAASVDPSEALRYE